MQFDVKKGAFHPMEPILIIDVSNYLSISLSIYHLSICLLDWDEVRREEGRVPPHWAQTCGFQGAGTDYLIISLKSSWFNCKLSQQVIIY